MKIEQLLQGKTDNHLLPVFWLQGEDEQTLRQYMQAIHRANCRAVCVQSHGHPDFCGEKWWQDLDVILDEARKLEMQVWIGDDSRFPTGWANGAMTCAPEELARRSVYCRTYPIQSGAAQFRTRLSSAVKKIPGLAFRPAGHGADHLGDRVVCLCAQIEGESLPVVLEWTQEGEQIAASLPEGTKKVYLTFTTRNAGIHRDYINLLDAASCRILIYAVYEPHYRRYSENFGTTIAGFVSNRPELGNGVSPSDHLTVGSDRDYPWSHELEQQLQIRWGENWQQYLPLLWHADADPETLASCRHGYMDTVTELVRTCFSEQLGKWCEDRAVRHLCIAAANNNRHARMGASAGHYFRGISGQHMAGIVDRGGQLIPYGEDIPAAGHKGRSNGRDGEFYHYFLGALAASAAAIDPKKQGSALCEVFGNYGWGTGPRACKYQADHFLSQGINYFAPYAFSAKPYPDKDCPPHFYAGGNHPQYRAYGALFAYLNRAGSLLSGGKAVVDTAVLYHGDSEWAGTAMLSQKITRILMENQVGYHVLSADVLTDPERFNTRMDDQGLWVNGYCYKTLLLPAADYIPQKLSVPLADLAKTGCKVLVAGGSLPKTTAGESLHDDSGIRSIVLAGVPEEVDREILLEPCAWRMRALHYRGEEEVYFFVNEDDKPFTGTVTLPETQELYAYDPWENKTYALSCENKEGKTRVALHLQPGESMFAVAGERAEYSRKALPCGGKARLVGKWKRSVCKAKDYPNFSEGELVREFTDYAQEAPKFSGFIAYETAVVLRERKRAVLEITAAGEDAELFINGKSAGIQVLPPFRYDITSLLLPGKNTIRIEIATTLERERGANKKHQAPTGIVGQVNLYTERVY